ncbi:MAG: phosphomethylpyrimidine synthase ThiC [Bacillota bacterium]
MQIDMSRRGSVTPELLPVASDEGLAPEDLAGLVASGEAVILHTRLRNDVRPVGIGKRLRTKVNANIGASDRRSCLEEEVAKALTAVEAGADTLMDLSSGRDVRAIRTAILEASEAPVGTVPVYQAALEAREREGSVLRMSPDGLFSVIEEQAAEGVTFMTLHAGLTRTTLESLRREGRQAGMVSRGGALLAAWMIHRDAENPLYEGFDRLLEILLRYDVVLSLGDALRPGSVADATDRPQIEELALLGELVLRARNAGVQVIVEGPGHVPLDQVEANVLLEKRLCHEAPFYVLGPLVTDVAPGYDHIAGAIGGALAAASGADFLCYLTPAEHLGLPSLEDVREGVIASRVAAHAGDLVKRGRVASAWDRRMARARAALDWEAQVSLSVDPERARKYRSLRTGEEPGPCSMCGALCAMDIVKGFLGREGSNCV